MALKSTIEINSYIGRYKVRSVLGKGSMGTVYRAYDPHLDRDVAIKLVHIPHSVNSEQADFLVQGLLYEGRLAARLNTRGIVQVYDLGQHEEHPYIVLELVEGAPLDDILTEQQNIEFEHTIHIMLSILHAMAYAHEEGVAHLDLKPGNVMVQHDGQVRITDFGISKTLNDLERKQGDITGTPAYMSPEQIQGQRVDLRSDVWSLGVMFYEILGADMPFELHSRAQLKFDIIHNQHGNLASLRPDLDPRFSEMIDIALSKDPEKRFANARTMLQFMERIIRRNRRREDFREGELICWDNRHVGVIKRRGVRNGADVVLALDANGDVTILNIPLYAFHVHSLGVVPESVSANLEQGMVWYREMVTPYLHKPPLAKFIPLVYAPESEVHTTGMTA